MAEGGEETVSATGGITEDEEKLLHALHLLGIKPKIGDAEDVKKFVTVFGSGAKTEPPDHTETPKHGAYHFPKLSTFYGEDGKGEASWATFSYEVEALLASKSFTEDQILLGVRRALKGNAADKLRRLGTTVTIREVMGKLESDYGTAESRESIMRKFYSCAQKQEENVEAYASRLEDLFDRAVKLDALRRSDSSILKEVFHAGLKKDIKLMTLFQKSRFISYEDLKREIRKLEADMKLEDNESRKACKAAVHTDSKTERKTEPHSELSEVKDMLQQINKRIDHLEKKEQRDDFNPDWYRPSYRDRGRGRGYRGQPHFRGRGRGDYRPNRPLGSNKFLPTCFLCNEKGHIQRNCPRITQQFVCTKCHEKGKGDRTMALPLQIPN